MAGDARWFSRFTFGVGEQNFNVIGSGVQYLDIYFTDPDNGWSVGTGGPIVRIANGSSASPSFSFQTSCPCPILNGIFMLNSLTGWAVGNGGVILKTTNGLTWSPQTSGTTVNLRSIHFVNANQGWAVGNGGLILKSTDGGATWTPETSGVTTDLRRVFFVNANRGYAVGHSGTILRYDSITSAANVSVSGRVFAANGRGVSRARVTLTGSEGQTRTAMSSRFGYYRFDDVGVGETYVFNVSSKRYHFTTQVVTVMDEISNLDFMAEP